MRVLLAFIAWENIPLPIEPYHIIGPITHVPSSAAEIVSISAVRRHSEVV